MFSIIIPLYNKEKSIQHTIESVKKQTFKDFEAIIIDDGSTDSSYKKASELIKRDSRFSIIQIKNQGVSNARNEGIRRASYKYIALLDADDRWKSIHLKEQNDLIKKYPEAGMWGMNYALVKNESTIELKTGLSKNFKGFVNDYFLLKKSSDLFNSSSVVIHKKCFEKVGLFDENIDYSEDLDLWYRILLNFPVVFNSLISVLYIQDAENRALNKSSIPLNRFLPFYVSKYYNYCMQNRQFSRFIHTFTANKLANYYFKNRIERNEARNVIPHIQYKDIHLKYRLFYKTPYPIGLFIYKLYSLKKRIWNKYNLEIKLISK